MSTTAISPTGTGTGTGSGAGVRPGVGALLAVEATRLRWRRAVLILLVVAVALPVVLFVARAVQTRPPSDDQIAQIHSQRSYQRELRQCQRSPESVGADDVASCEAVVDGFFSNSDSLRPSQELRDGYVLGVATLLAVLMLVTGATFAGGDWASGSMSNQLLFEPRRARVWAAKALAVTAYAGAVSVVVLLAAWFGVVALAHQRGIALSSGLVGDGVEQSLRAAGLAAGLALGGFALSMLLRSTVGTLGIVFAVAVLGGVLIALVGGEGSARWQPGLNVAAIVSNDASYYVPDPECVDTKGEYCNQVERHLTAVGGLEYTVPVLVLVIGASVLSFRRRDVP